MAGFLQGDPVGAPPEELAPYGLLSLGPALDFPGDTAEHWINGIDFESRRCAGVVHTRDICSGTEVSTLAQAATGGLVTEFYPYVIDVTDICVSTFGFASKDYPARVTNLLNDYTQKAMEAELLHGTQAQASGNGNAYLSQVSTVIVGASGGPWTPKDGLALLEGAVGNIGSGGRGVIHMTRTMASSIIGLREDTQGRLVTPMGNYVIAGTGYDGTGPGGIAPNVTPSGTTLAVKDPIFKGNVGYMYATGKVSYALGDVDVITDKLSQVMDIGINSINMKAERPAGTFWDGCAVYAVHVDITADQI